MVKVRVANSCNPAKEILGNFLVLWIFRKSPDVFLYKCPSKNS